MRLKIAADTLPEWFALRHPEFPHPMVEVMGAMLLSRALMAGVRFGVFDRLHKRSMTTDEIAADAQCDSHGMELLLRALVACGYLTQADGRYRNSQMAERWLLPGEEQTAANFVRYNYDQWEWVSRMEEFIEHGRARNIHDTINTPEGWRRYLLGLEDTARLAAGEVLRHVRTGRHLRSLLDAGAGHCHYALALCRVCPELHVTVVDLEPAARIGRERVEQAGLAARFTFSHGTVSEAPLSEGHDLAFLFNLVHHLDEETAQTALRRIHQSLAPSGRLVILDEFAGESAAMPKDQLEGLLSLFFGLASGRRAYGFDQVEEWARAAGFLRFQRVRLRTVPLASLLIADK